MMTRPCLETETGGLSTTVKMRFSADEDDRLRKLVEAHGVDDWGLISSAMGTRNARQCRERFRNYLDPELRHGQWTVDEDRLLCKHYGMIGAKWGVIVKFFQNRSEMALRNRFYAIQKGDEIGRETQERVKKGKTPKKAIGMERRDRPDILALFEELVAPAGRLSEREFYEEFGY